MLLSTPLSVSVSARRDEAKGEGEAALLLVTSGKDREYLELVFEQYIQDPVLRKHGKDTWILPVSNQSGNPAVEMRKGAREYIFFHMCFFLL